MSCERYWREGIVLVEHGQDDPHRDGCEDCQRAHASRQELIEALPLVGADDTGDPNWQSKVWRRLDRDSEDARAPWRWRWQLAGALAMACVIALWVRLDHSRQDPALGDGPVAEVRHRAANLRNVSDRIEIVKKGDVVMRSLSAHAEDRLRIDVGETSDVRIYRDDDFVVSYRTRRSPPTPTPGADRTFVEYVLAVPGIYRVLVIEAALSAPDAPPPRGRRDRDCAALEAAGVLYKEQEISVH